MNKIRPQSLDAECLDRSARADVLLRRDSEEEEEEEEEDKGNGTGNEDDDEEEDDGGYSVQVYRLCQW